MQINDPDVVAEIEAALARYEKALVDRDVEILGDCFWNDPRVVRFGTHENLFGHAEIQAFRKSVKPGGHAKESVLRTVITTFGKDFACVSIAFAARRGGTGRQQQSWARLPQGWKVVAAHVSYMPEPPASS